VGSSPNTLNSSNSVGRAEVVGLGVGHLVGGGFGGRAWGPGVGLGEGHHVGEGFGGGTSFGCGTETQLYTGDRYDGAGTGCLVGFLVGFGGFLTLVFSFKVGDSDGASETLGAGEIVGSVGSLVGFRVGFRVGRRVGFRVGRRVGLGVGLRVGNTVGHLVGGRCVGHLVGGGLYTGTYVGAGTGS